ncbi:MAG: ECF transporter S component [Thaumarchaeota archaeon]|nr:ECF transporter S component [Nitrososphaerota archaeon]
MGNILFFSRREFVVIVAIGIVSGLIDDKAEMFLFASVAHTHILVLVNDYLAYVTRGPVFGDLLETWLEYGALIAACLVRKPAAATLALTINGCCQVFVNGTHDPHLLYGLPGLGADIVFALFRYKRYDVPVVCLAGISCAVFWYPVVWFTHGIYQFPLSFVLADFAFRILGGAVGDGLLGGALALIILSLAGQRWNGSRPSSLKNGDDVMKHATPFGLLTIGFGVLVIVLTFVFSSVSNFFLSIGPKIPSGNPLLEEYNPGYIIGVLLIFLVLTMLAFWKLRSRFSD